MQVNSVAELPMDLSAPLIAGRRCYCGARAAFTISPVSTMGNKRRQFLNWSLSSLRLQTMPQSDATFDPTSQPEHERIVVNTSYKYREKRTSTTRLSCCECTEPSSCPSCNLFAHAGRQLTREPACFDPRHCRDSRAARHALRPRIGDPLL